MATTGKKKALWVVTLVLVAGLVGYGVNDAMTREAEREKKAAEAAAAEAAGKKDPEQPELLAVGTTAPDFTLKDLSGKAFSLKEYRGKKKVLLEFFSSRCPHCQHSTPFLNTIEENFKDEVKLLAVNAGDDPKKGPSTTPVFQTTFHTTYTILEAPERAVPTSYHLRGFPTSYLIDEQGKIIWVREGTITSQIMVEFEKAVDGTLEASKEKSEEKSH